MASETITKRSFAAAMGVHPSQVTRWAMMGMPEAANGRIDPATAAAWVRENVDQSQRERRSIGAADQARGEKVRRNEAVDELQRLAIWMLAQQIPGAVAEAAVQIGMPVDLVKKLHTRLLIRVPDLANAAREMMLIEPGDTGPFQPMKHLPAPDWIELQKTAAAMSSQPANRRRTGAGKAA